MLLKSTNNKDRMSIYTTNIMIDMMTSIPRTKASEAELWCFFDLRLNKRLSKQWWGWWFETPSRPVWCHFNDDRSLTMDAARHTVWHDRRTPNFLENTTWNNRYDRLNAVPISIDIVSHKYWSLDYWRSITLTLMYASHPLSRTVPKTTL